MFGLYFLHTVSSMERCSIVFWVLGMGVGCLFVSFRRICFAWVSMFFGVHLGFVKKRFRVLWSFLFMKRLFRLLMSCSFLAALIRASSVLQKLLN